MNDTVFCCQGFEHRIADAGQRGIAVVVHKTSAGIIFFIQSRGIAFEDVGKIRPIPIDIKINVASDVGMQYCPFCGRKLQELVIASPEFFDDLAENHKKLQTVKT